MSDHHLKIKVSCETSSRIAINVEKVIVEPKEEEELVDLECQKIFGTLRSVKKGKKGRVSELVK